MAEKRVVELNEFDHRVVIEALADRRNDFIAEQKPTEDVNSVLMQIIDAPTKKEHKKEKRRKERDER